MAAYVVGPRAKFIDRNAVRVFTPRAGVQVIYTSVAYNIYFGGVLSMPKRLIDLDDDLLSAAQQELKTTGVSDTVRLALQQAAALSARARQVAWLQSGGLAEMVDADRRGDVWR